MEIAKLCYQQHHRSLIEEINSIMPDMYDPATDRKTKSMTAHNYKYTSKYSRTLPKNCIKLWNNLPTEAKDMAYTDSSIKQFTRLAKVSVIQNH